MTSVRQTTVVTSSTAGHPTFQLDGGSLLDGSLDALLEDLQNSVSRPGSSLGMTNSHVNGPTSGNTTSRVVTQREVRVQRVAGAGSSVPSVQYLQPANSTTVVAERASSPLLTTVTSPEDQQRTITTYKTYQTPEEQQRTVTSYKTYQYQYRTDAQQQPSTVSGILVDGKSPRSRSISPPPHQKIIYSDAESPPAAPNSDTRMHQNLNELDSLLVDLHHAQQSTPNVDPNSATAQQITRTVRTYQFDNTYGTPNSVRRELYPQPSPKPVEHSSRARSPPSQHINTTYTTSTTSPVRTPSPIRAPSPTRKVTTTVKTYTYEIPVDNPAIQPVVSSPTIKTYSYELPPDKASPPPEDTIITYKYTSIPRNPPAVLKPAPPSPETTTVVKTYKYPSHPVEREPLMTEPPKQQPPHNNTYITYNYSSTTSSSGHPGHPSPSPPYQMNREPPHRPFPTPVPTPPASAEPPKRLDELMASFTDTDTPVPAAPLDSYPDTATVAPAPARPAPVQERARTKNIAGPPVYYPPGVELFSRKDEPVHAKMKEGATNPTDGGGKGSGAGVAAVPVCLPLCCAMPCVIL
ncbi:hypothetical protein B566_EDAN010510 [Ephemera danica]|nr:hypothetical protein B566_EDAN010510 [Ephemera danica]